MRYAICNIDIRIPIPDDATKAEIEDIVYMYELPKEYKEDTFEFVGTEEDS